MGGALIPFWGGQCYEEGHAQRIAKTFGFGLGGVCGHLLQLTGDDGGEQELRLIWRFRLGENGVLPVVLPHECHRSCPSFMAQASIR